MQFTQSHRKTIYAIAAGFLLAIFASSFSFALAQETGASATTTDTAAATTTPTLSKIPSDVLLDEEITFADLGAVEANVLPGSPLHPFKRFGWALKEIITFDPVADAELKIQHANQELSEVKQLIEERGLANVSPDIINAAIERFGGRLDSVKGKAGALRIENESDPERVDGLLNNLTDKQFKYQKVLDLIEKKVIETKSASDGTDGRIEDVFIKVADMKNKTLEDYGEVLSSVETEPEKIAERLIKVADKQSGSEFKHLKNLEVLKRLEEQVPISAQGAIKLAQENTLKFFSRDISVIPETERAERFKAYSRFSYGDETRQLNFLDDLKQLPDIPPDILEKIEEVKEFAIRKLEDKLQRFEKPEVYDNYLAHLSGDNFSDLVLADELSSRAVFENRPEIKERMDEIRNKSVEEFKKLFTDEKSQSQVEKFQELEQILSQRPGDPKVIKMLNELENQVRSDPSKAAFLEQFGALEEKMRAEFEKKIAAEGELYFNRISTLDPRDFDVYRGIENRGFVPPEYVAQFIDHGVDEYKKYVRSIDDPVSFDRFNDRFSNVSDVVISDIKQYDAGFGDVMQYKRQAMEKLRFEQERELEINRRQVDYQERELFYQLDRVRRQADEEFWRKINSIPYENFDERARLFDEKQNADLARLDEERKAKMEIFNARVENDPWCDSACGQIQKQFIEQEIRHQRERIQDDYLSQQKQIEFDLARQKMDNPFFGLCETPQDCEQYCASHPDFEPCRPFFHQPVYSQSSLRDGFAAKDYDCGQGKYFDFGRNECMEDPYYRPPTDFEKCPPGTRFVERGGFCEPNYIPTPVYEPVSQKPDCGPDSYFDFKENRCVSYRIERLCPPGFYPGPYGGCQENLKCAPLSVMEPIPCPAGQYRGANIIDANGCPAFGKCVLSDNQPAICPDLSAAMPAPCPAGAYRGPDKTDQKGCRAFGECLPLKQPTSCPDYAIGPCPAGTYRGDGYANKDGCYVPGKCIAGADIGNSCGGFSGIQCPAGYKCLTPPDSADALGKCALIGTTGTTTSPITCNAYFEGYAYDSYSKSCKWSSTSACSNPYKYRSLKECEEGNRVSASTNPVICPSMPTVSSCPAGAEKVVSFTSPECGTYYTCSPAGTQSTTTSLKWVDHIWYFSDGSANSSILNRTDTEYKNYIAEVGAKCKTISKSKFFWKAGAGNDSPDNWQNFGIPDCSGAGAGTNYWCGNNVCDPGENSSYCPSDCGGGSTGGGSSAMQKCFYPNASINGAPTGFTVWCEADYYNCHQGDPSGAVVSLSNLSLGAPNFCESWGAGDTGTACNSNGFCDSGESSGSCPSDCGGYTPPYTTTTGSVDSSDSACADLQDILPGCHIMSESPNVRFNSAMDKYVEVGTRTIQQCSSKPIPGCTSYYSTGTGGYCGDSACNNAETALSCPSDCGSGGGSSTYCPPPSYWDSAVNGCSSGTDYSSGWCGDGTCDSNESSSSCWSDCGEGSTGGGSSTYCPPPSYWDSAASACKSDTDSSCNHNGVCDPNEYAGYCPDDCGVSSGTGGTTESSGGGQACGSAADFGTCDNGYNYDSNGCVTGCLSAPPPYSQPPPSETTSPSSETPTSEPPPETSEPPPTASVWQFIKSFFFSR